LAFAKNRFFFRFSVVCGGEFKDNYDLGPQAPPHPSFRFNSNLRLHLWFLFFPADHGYDVLSKNAQMRRSPKAGNVCQWFRGAICSVPKIKTK